MWCLQRTEQSSGDWSVRWHIELQPWASPTPSLNYEASRFLKYISTSQISCEHKDLNSLKGYSETTKKPWSICLDERFSLIHRIRSKQCRLYSLGLGSDDNQFELSMANSGCEVHRFDPSIKSAHIQEGRHLWYHRLSIDWRDPNPAIAAHKLHSNTKKLGTVLNEFGHQKIDVLKADVESAEWKILENLILEDVVEQIGQLVFEVHIHWPGFEVSGNDSTVVRYWYSLLRELELKDFRLFHTYKDLSKPQMFLKKEAFNASSCYTLSWDRPLNEFSSCLLMTELPGALGISPHSLQAPTPALQSSQSIASSPGASFLPNPQAIHSGHSQCQPHLTKTMTGLVPDVEPLLHQLDNSTRRCFRLV
ncbi:hypothetical protein HGM15179_016345 [Zosterops borbonicus]|uniref:Methyltransferase domain-containing protein n=1 Tax=Zosterops borbonicus TaxID=364589 RepID=A0A8K1G347_9PASS|nr:hypothetical protein HGM15179_016345 [Zosterops borbonicus]